MALKTEREKCAHLLRRFGLGASEAELDYYLQGRGLEGAIEKLLNYDRVDEGFDLPVESLVNQNGQLNMPLVERWWYQRLLQTRRPLQEKMTIFWHDHFATSASKVKQPMLMYGQNEIIRANATGTFKNLITEVSKDPAMLLWLDNQENVVGKPNENFAREVMELFTLGIGNYTEQDIQESARCFTGWSYRRAPGAAQGIGRGSAEYFFRPFAHDNGVKTIFGQRGNFGGEDVISMLCANPQTSKYVTTKLWEFFVYEKPEPAVVERFSRVFLSSGLNIKTLLTSIMHSDEFYSDKAERGVYKNPIDFSIVTLRQLGVGELAVPTGAGDNRLRGLQGASVAAQGCEGMGMQLFFPPDVAGWDWGAAWITTATMLERIGWAERIFGIAQQARGRAVLRNNAFGIFQKDPTPEGVARKLVSIFDVRLPANKMDNLIEAANKASGGRVTQQNANATAAAVARLIFASPEFQFC